MKNKLLSKIIVYLSVIAIVTSCFVFPAAATSVDQTSDAVDKSIVNLLPADSYKYAESNGKSASLTKPVLFFDNVTWASWSWNMGNTDVGFTSFILTIEVSNNRVPDSLSMVPYSGGPSINFLKVGSTGNYAQYKYVGSLSLALFTLKATWNASYSGRYNIVSFYGVRSDIVTMDLMSYQVTRFYTGSNGDTTSGIINNALAASTPIKRIYQDPMSNYFDKVTMSFRYARFNYNYVDSMSLLIATRHPEATITAYIADDAKPSDWSSAAIYKTVPVIGSESYTSKTMVDDGYLYNLYFYLVTVDLRGIDLSGKMVNFVFDVYPDAENSAYWEVLYATYRLPTEDIPWYQVVYHWFKSLWQQENDTLIDQIVGAINGDQSQGDQVANDVGKLENGSEQLGQLTQDMQVDKPDISGDSVDISNISDPTANALMATTMAAFWQSPTIVSILLFLCTVILISFVFFGKKG